MTKKLKTSYTELILCFASSNHISLLFLAVSFSDLLPPAQNFILIALIFLGQGGHSYLKEWLWWAGLLSSKSLLLKTVHACKTISTLHGIAQN